MERWIGVGGRKWGNSSRPAWTKLEGPPVAAWLAQVRANRRVVPGRECPLQSGGGGMIGLGSALEALRFWEKGMGMDWTWEKKEGDAVRNTRPAPVFFFFNFFALLYHFPLFVIFLGHSFFP